MMKRLRNPACAVAAPQEVARAYLGELRIIDISQFDETADKCIHLRFIVPRPSPFA